VFPLFPPLAPLPHPSGSPVDLKGSILSFLSVGNCIATGLYIFSPRLIGVSQNTLFFFFSLSSLLFFRGRGPARSWRKTRLGWWKARSFFLVFPFFSFATNRLKLRPPFGVSSVFFFTPLYINIPFLFRCCHENTFSS